MGDVVKSCKHCGIEIIGRAAQAKYCSSRCVCSAFKKKNKEKVSVQTHELHRDNPAVHIFRQARYRAAKKNLEFNLEVADVVVADKCPVLGIDMAVNRGKFSAGSPSLDRIDNSKGYVKGNVWVISRRANALKNDATLAELKLIVEALERVQRPITYPADAPYLRKAMPWE